MANYTVTLYKTTGFNEVNIPDSPSLLHQCPSVSATAIGIMQDRFLDEIRISCPGGWDSIKDCDYLKLGTTTPQYYFIDSIRMVATDSAMLSLSIDYINTAGGIDGFQVLDGVTSRVHVIDDSFGKYCEDDPLTAPAQPLQVVEAWIAPVGENSESHVYVESTVNLPRTGAGMKGKKYATVDDEDVIVPDVIPLASDEHTEYTIQGISGLQSPVNPMTMLYDLSNTSGGGYNWDNVESIRRGIAACRSLGIEQGAVINQVIIPSVYATPTVTTAGVTVPDPDGEEGDTIVITNSKLTTMTGKAGVQTQSALLYRYATNAVNNRVNYGSFTPFGLITCSGESCEYNAEDIMEDISGQNQITSPSVAWLADPHTSGKPYFRWKVVNKMSAVNGSGQTNVDFFRNCVSGLQWKQVPLFYNDPSGTAINRLNYNNNRKLANIERSAYWDESNTSNLGRTLQSTISGFAGLALNGSPSSPFNAAASILADTVNTYTQQENYDKKYYQKKRNELSELYVNNTINAPTINFPYNSEVMRDYYGNGVLAYRYQYSADDISRIDKLLTMYGYKHTKALENSDFKNRTNFNYVECSNVTVKGHTKWLNDGVSMMLKNGVRVWHVMPDISCYTNNPIRQNA